MTNSKISIELNIQLVNRLIIAILIMLVVSGCSNFNNSSSGVARIDKSEGSLNANDSKPKSGGPAQLVSGENASDTNTDTPELTDEEVTTKFTACLRNHGFEIIDPVLRPDGSVDRQTLRQGIMQDPKFQSGGGRKTLGECLPILQEATFSQRPSGEDEIEIEDNLLKFAQCLRDNGIDAPDPDFSSGPRAAMQPLYQGLRGADSRVQRVFNQCTEDTLRTNRTMGGGRQ